MRYDSWQPGSLSSIGPLKRVLAVNKPIQMAPDRGFKHRPAGSDCPLAVDVRGLSLTFETSDGKVEALSGIDLKIAQREFVSFIGPSGCGKTTLLRIIADLEQPTAGTVEVGGKTPHPARLDQDYGIAFQQAGLLDGRSVVENVELPLQVHGVDRAARRARAGELLE